MMSLLFKSPHIASYVRILEIDFEHLNGYRLESMDHNFQTITQILSMSSGLRCILLVAPDRCITWNQLPQSFKTAVENCLHLPTLQEVHVSHLDFPLSILDKHAPNINYFFLSGSPQIPDYTESDNANPQLRSLSFDVDLRRNHHHKFFITWAKRHIVKLQSLECAYLDQNMISELLGICSGTLTSLDLYLTSGPYETIDWRNKARKMHGSLTSSINLSSLPHLQHLTLRADIYHQEHPEGYEEEDDFYISNLPALVAILKSLPPSDTLHLIIEIRYLEDHSLCSLSEEDFPLFPNFFKALAESSAFVPHIDVYLFSDYNGLIDTEIASLFGDYGLDLLR